MGCQSTCHSSCPPSLHCPTPYIEPCTSLQQNPLASHTFVPPYVGIPPNSQGRVIVNQGAWLQIYGVPTVRHDIKAPRKQSIANAQNYGNEPNSKQLIHPAAMVERGIHEQHFLQQMPKDAIRQVKVHTKVLELVFVGLPCTSQCSRSLAVTHKLLRPRL